MTATHWLLLLLTTIVFTKTDAFPLDDAGDNATIFIDERQNGTENYRINIDGVVIAISSLESLLSATLSDFEGFDDDFEFETPKPVVVTSNSTQSAAAEPIETNSTTNTTIGGNAIPKYKRRRFGVPGLMRSIFKRKQAQSV